MAGTQEWVVQQAANEVKAAAARLKECERAQTGTPLARETASARSKLSATQDKFGQKYDDYETHMLDHNQRPKPRSAFI